MPLFYENKMEEALDLSKALRKDGATLEDIQEYWGVLGYDFFFIRKLMKELKEDENENEKQ